MAFLWFLDDEIDETPPDHSILSKARVRFGCQMYQAFFAEIVRQCQACGLIEGQSLLMDKALLRANASLEATVSRALQEELHRTPDEYLSEVWQTNPSPNSPPEPDHSPPKSRKPRINERLVSRTDPDATIVRRKDAKLFLGHELHIGVDGGEARIVTSVVATSGTVRETKALPVLLWQHMKTL